MLPSYRNQSIELKWKFVEWFLWLWHFFNGLCVLNRNFIYSPYMIKSRQVENPDLLSYRQKLLVISQKGESQNGCIKKTKHAKFSDLVCFIFLKHQFWDPPVCLITDEVWFQNLGKNKLRHWLQLNFQEQCEYFWSTWEETMH